MMLISTQLFDIDLVADVQAFRIIKHTSLDPRADIDLTVETI